VTQYQYKISMVHFLTTSAEVESISSEVI